MAFSKGARRGEAVTLSCIFEGVIDLLLFGRGILGLALEPGVSWLTLDPCVDVLYQLFC